MNRPMKNLSTKTITLISIGIVALLMFMTSVGAYNGAAKLRNTYNMKVKSNSAEFDNLWKKLKQAASVPAEKKDALREIFEGYADKRSSDSKDQVMTWIKESVPNVDLTIYDKLMNIITGSRDTWTMKQTELVSIAEQYNAKLAVFPGNFFLPMMGFEPIEPKVITSDRTEEVFAESKDNDTDLFKK